MLKVKGKPEENGMQEVRAVRMLIDSCLHHMTDLKAASELSVQYVELTRDIEAAALMSFSIKNVGKFVTVFYGLQYQ